MEDMREVCVFVCGGGWGVVVGGGWPASRPLWAELTLSLELRGSMKRSEQNASPPPPTVTEERARVCAHACVFVWVCVCVFIRVCVCVFICLGACLCSYV